VPSHFPALDCHAHIDPSVTPMQVRQLRGAQIFAMTRTLAEAAIGIANPFDNLHWGVGVHPGVKGIVDHWNETAFGALLEDTFLVGEVGLDRRGASREHVSVFRDVLTASGGRVVSIHSAGCVDQVLDAVEEVGVPGAVLHWFLGDRDQIERASRLGCFFSINAAMTDDAMRGLPYERVLPETDFPASRGKTRASVPGDIRELERRVAALTQTSELAVRRHWYQVLGNLVHRTATLNLLPPDLHRLVVEAGPSARS
jgi:TatD DNase family protein